MAVQMTEAQFQQLLAMIGGQKGGDGAGQAAGAAAVVGPMQHCQLGRQDTQIQEMGGLDLGR